MPKLLILIPTYNRKQFLYECLAHLKEQTFADFQVVVYDDGSTDDTAQMVWEKRAEFPPVTFIRSEENHGVAFARNKLFQFVEVLAVKPEFLAWQDSDDFSHKNRLELMVKALEAQNAQIAFSHMYFFLHPNKHTRTRTVHKIDVTKYTTDEQTLNNNMNFATAVFRTELVKYKFDETLRRNEDGKWLLQLINNGIKIGYYQNPLYYCRRHDGRLTYQARKKV